MGITTQNVNEGVYFLSGNYVHFLLVYDQTSMNPLGALPAARQCPTIYLSTVRLIPMRPGVEVRNIQYLRGTVSKIRCRCRRIS